MALLAVMACAGIGTAVCSLAVPRPGAPPPSEQTMAGLTWAWAALFVLAFGALFLVGKVAGALRPRPDGAHAGRREPRPDAPVCPICEEPPYGRGGFVTCGHCGGEVCLACRTEVLAKFEETPFGNPSAPLPAEYPACTNCAHQIHGLVWAHGKN